MHLMRPDKAQAVWAATRLEILFVTALGLLAALVFVPSLLQGTRSFFVWPDAQEQTYAWWQKLAHCWQQGYLPLWDANTFSGHSFVGEFQAGVFYPLAWLWLMLWSNTDGMSVAALEVFILLHFAIAAAGMGLLLRYWSLGRLASASGAVVFALLGPVAERAAAQPNIFFGLCWLPWALFFASNHLATGRLRYALSTGAVIALQVLAGHIQPAYHTVLMVAAMVIAHHSRIRPNWRATLTASLRSGFPMIAALLLLAAPQWILSFQYLSDAYRWVGANWPIGPGQRVPYKVFAFQHVVAPGDLPNLIDPWRFIVDDANSLYMGTVTLGLIGWFLASSRRRASIRAWREHGRWLTIIAVFAVVAMLGHYTPLAAVLRYLPLIGGIRELGRYTILFHVAACVLAACAIEALKSEYARERWRSPIAWIVLLIVLVPILYLSHHRAMLSPESVYALALSACVGAVFLFTGSGRATAACSFATLVITACLFSRLAVPKVHLSRPVTEAFAPINLLAKLDDVYGRDRVIIDESAQLPQNYADARRLQTPYGHAATMYRPYFDFLSRDGSLGGEVNDLLNVRYVLSRKPLDLPLVATDASGGLHLYERPTAYSRVFLASQYGTEPALRRAKFDVLQYDDQTQRFRIHVERRGQAIVSEIAYPGWCARVNGKSERIERAKLGGIETPLRAVWLDAGDNDIQFRYRPFHYLLFGCD